MNEKHTDVSYTLKLPRNSLRKNTRQYFEVHKAHIHSWRLDNTLKLHFE